MKQVQEFENVQTTMSRKTISNLEALSREELVSELFPIIKEFDATLISEPMTSKQLVVDHIAKAEMEDPFYIVDIGVIVKQYLQFIKLLPRVTPFYAIKCNPHPAIMKTIALLGGCFDCASKTEIANAMALGMDAHNDIIFANPCKQLADIRYARQTGVNMVTFDNEHELIKIKEHWPEAGLVMRIITDDSQSICKFSSKFGVPLNNTTDLISKVKQYGLNLVGISFHVGSGCLSVKSFEAAVRSAHSVFEEAKRQGFDMKVLDIGGGFPGSDDVKPTFPEIANVIRPLIDELFDESVRVIAEPGRYFAAASHILCCNVFSKRTTDVFAEESTEKTREFLYYINDGVYGSFNCILFDHATVTPLVVKEPMIATGEIESTYISTLFGPTCDSMDTIAKRILLPELHVGDWLYFDNFGAYTLAAGSAFNGFKTSKHHYILRI